MRLKSCKKCGITFSTDREGAYLCPQCSLQSKRDSVIRERVCKSCGVTFMGSPRAWYCPKCREIRTKEANKRCKMSKTVRRIGSTDICSVCGKEYTVNGARQKYCKDCAEEATKKVVRAHKIEYNRAHKETLYPHKEKMRNNGYVCVVCGKIFDKSTPTVTCSPECRIQLKKKRIRERNYRNGKRKLPPDQLYDSGLPKSGIVGVTFHRKLQKWQATYKGQYLGLYDTIQEAAKSIEQYKDKIS